LQVPAPWCHEDGVKISAQEILYADSQMFKAAKSGNNTKIITLLSQGENIDERDKLGWTPLFEAISWGKIETAKLLIKNKASINIVNSEGNTPLHLASFLGLLVF